ncbi:hypothetical protein TRFO_09137 [Tritrichomonas foetus]|uniref:G-protein alpha subunit n=1 Tax=Tritrichomonas foetus TaxID=1144522 RepID=A0A1J4JFI7_9EUKA|nr:hypothetical protein TRFO_09137 [Tritrichomonas foetus]|eukprot:OHS97982.1 hypothetical protein TRFO_09137 [Tritrichomonas foetus]
MGCCCLCFSGRQSVDMSEDLLDHQNVLVDVHISDSGPLVKIVRNSESMLAISQIPEDCETKLTIALFGPQISGKSTFFKQFCLMLNEFSDIEREAVALSIRYNIIESIQQIVYFAIKKYNFLIDDEVSYLLKINKYDEKFSHQMINDIKSLWNNDVIQQSYKEIRILDICDNLDYLMSVFDSDDLPSNETVIRNRIRTTGLREIKFYINNLDVTLLDIGGEKCEQKKWNRFNFDIGMFFVSLSDFDCLDDFIEFDNHNEININTNKNNIADNNVNNSNTSNNNVGDDKINNTYESENEKLRNSMNKKENLMIFMTFELFRKTLKEIFKEKLLLFVVFNKLDLFREKMKENPNTFIDVFPEFTSKSTNSFKEDECLNYLQHKMEEIVQEEKIESLKVIFLPPTSCVDKELTISLANTMVQHIIEIY